ncbi:PIN domain-containing protein [Roseateles sp. DAIF2]|uniref:PIN domain-containing protein n=1 Tax=Roseateles sp. DAIF2 TaxID=2714952 RepID=UPI0018A2C240|nr:hypothetical protein [Roseateles sp. DAIF2]QPF71540.1 PIN domain-containing protein [Roseateles sp. DAIF2]
MRTNKAATVPAVVFDTPLLLRTLLSGDASARRLRQAWQQGRCRALVDADSARALVLALGSPALRLTPEQQRELLADYLPYAEIQQAAPAQVPVEGQVLSPFDLLALDLARASGQPCRLVSDSAALKKVRWSRGRKASPVELVASEDFLTQL